MKFDYTYITVLGYTIFEPMVLLINSIFFVMTIIFARRLFLFKNNYARQMGLFILSLGAGMIFGAIGHAVHLQAGERFFSLILLLMNLCSLFSVLFCFRGCYFLLKGAESKKMLYGVSGILAAMLVVSMIRGDFTIIKVMAGLVLLFALYAHHMDWKRNRRPGDNQVKVGILVSFLSLISHSLHISFGEWFNHKDVAHVIMTVGMMIIYIGIRKNAEDLVAI